MTHTLMFHVRVRRHLGVNTCITWFEVVMCNTGVGERYIK